ncbi:peptidase, partial [Vibrio parahaemolyticus]
MAPLAGDAFEVLSKNDGQTTVSLRAAVIDPQGLPLTLESVVATGQGCEAPSTINKQALTFTVDNAKPELCFYRYSVKNHPAQASLAKTSEANSYVLKS